MALAETTVHNVLSGGADTNAGAYNPARAGAVADYTQQTAAQYAYTDLVIGSTGRTVTSAARPFVSTDRGNHLRTSAGTGFTLDLFEIVDVTGNVATLDKAIGTPASTAGSAKLGGGLLTVAAALAKAVLGNTIWSRIGISTALGDVSLQLVSAPAATATHRARGLWRELTGEAHPNPICDQIVDKYIEMGLRWLNRKLRYHFEDTTVTLVAETQEYTLDEDVFEIEWVEWNGKLLEKCSVEQWRTKQVAYRQMASGIPKEWAFYGNKLVLLPKPSADAFNTAGTATVRGITTPVMFASYGLAQLAVQDQDIPVIKAAALWAKAHPDSALALQRRDSLDAEAKEMVEEMKDYYTRRLVSR